jgi:hypothetical protein
MCVRICSGVLVVSLTGTLNPSGTEASLAASWRSSLLCDEELSFVFSFGVCGAHDQDLLIVETTPEVFGLVLCVSEPLQSSSSNFHKRGVQQLEK